MAGATLTNHRVRTVCAVTAKRLDEAKASLDEGWGPVILVQREPFPGSHREGD